MSRCTRATGPWARVWLVTLTCAVCVVLAPATAWAAGAPMCDESAQSIEAPPTIWPSNGGSIQAVPSCPEISLWQDAGLPERVSTLAPLVPREVPFVASVGLVARPPTERLPVPSAGVQRVLPGHYPNIYRPPRA